MRKPRTTLPGAGRAPETALYQPLKRHLAGLGFDVKGEVCRCDLMGLAPGDPPFVIICEQKRSLSLEVVLQAVDRLSVADEVYIAVPSAQRPSSRVKDRRFRRLCRLLGIGLITVAADGRVKVEIEPGPYRPRPNVSRRNRLIEEHCRREGDPTPGGTVNAPILTSYRQEALGLAALLIEGPQRVRDLKTRIPKAQAILGRDCYGWFTRLRHGVYAVNAQGRAAVERWHHG
ncbi:MAG TPA: DUF2161 family putative PD-(D/E)XK-type phosphodiesterase [Afifellaceae bacterium]|nr:DUF2161 family putative PD-(D/E)XK-type phosphodiesterase [Afifellaceae bacterium]